MTLVLYKHRRSEARHLECELPDSVAQNGGRFSLINAGRPPIYLVEPSSQSKPPSPTVFDIIRVQYFASEEPISFMKILWSASWPTLP